MPRARLKVDSGVAVAGRTVRDYELTRYASRIVEHLGLTGVVNVQLKRDGAGVPKLLEINPRFPGTMPLTIAAGVDMPTLALGELVGAPITVPSRFEEVAIVRTWQEHHIGIEELEALGAPAPMKRSA